MAALGPLLRVARNVTDLARATEFYRDALGFSCRIASAEDPELAEILGVDAVRKARLVLGRQELELTECHSPGALYPANLQSDDRRFQHIAIVTTDIHGACARALGCGAMAISLAGAVLLPVSSGGVRAWKFRDPDGHALEFLQFPPGSSWQGAALHLGYDHSAIGVADTGRSIGFYGALGLQLRHRHLNQGAEQDRLDNLAPSIVEIVSLAASDRPPHLELLGYAHCGNREPVEVGASDIAADRLVFGNAPGALELRPDPDGHLLLLDGRK